MQRRASDCALLGNAKPNPTLKRRVGTLNSCTILHHYLTFAHYHNQKKNFDEWQSLKTPKATHRVSTPGDKSCRVSKRQKVEFPAWHEGRQRQHAQVWGNSHHPHSHIRN